MASKAKIDLYTAGTPNGHKINITLEELGLEYNVHKIDIAKDEQKEAWYLKINPNGRIPALIDNNNNPTTPPLRLFEGASIQLYLTSTYDTPNHTISFAPHTPEYWECLNWLIWAQSGLGPMQGQANHFHRYAPQRIEYAVQRYQTETRRLYAVLEARLAEQEGGGKGLWLVGGKYSIADICSFSWVNWAEWAGVDLQKGDGEGREASPSPFPLLKRWRAAIEARPAVGRGCDIPEKFEMREAMRTKEGEKAYAAHHSGWVMRGMKDDQEKHK